MLLIYSGHISTRLQYIASVIMPTIGITDWQITTNKDDYLTHEGAKINYSHTRTATKECWIIPHTILFENSIAPQSIIVNQWNQMPVFFESTESASSLPFDIFAAAFYLISRYEEYLPHEKDTYGRYCHTQSLAYKHQFLHLPIVNMWLQQLKQRLQQLFGQQVMQPTHFSYIPTYDIDIAYQYQHQPIGKNIGRFLRDFALGNLDAVTEQAKVFSNMLADPFDVFPWLNNLHHQHQLQPIYFVLSAIKKGLYDKNIPLNNIGMRQLVTQLQSQAQVGIHPSWQSHNHFKILKEEVNLLQQATQTIVNQSRQHYIQFSLPQTYEQLILLGITHDYSMGYGSINGFRASFARPFQWFNLTVNKPTALTVHPFCYMDANAIFEEKLTPEEAEKQLQHYLHVVQQVNGTFITIFHNHFLTSQPDWLPWRMVYQNFLSSLRIE